MQCEREIEVLELLDGQLPDAARSAVQAHLAACPRCAALAREWTALDRALARHIQPPALSAAFDARLRERIRAERALLTEDQRARRRREIEAQYQAELARMRTETRLAMFLGGANAAGFASLALLGVWILKERWNWLLESCGAFWSAQPALALGILGATAALGCFLAARSPQARQYLSAD